jgi:tetratricopeptide (TPR) repeat protein
MGVLIESENVLIRNATVEQRLPGGMQEYERRCPNGTYCTDGQICRVGFMVAADAASYIDYLDSLGFARPTRDGSPEVAIVNHVTGFVQPCDWLELNRIDLGGDSPTAVAWLRGTALSQFVAPPHWKPGKMVQIARKELSKREFLGTKEGVDVFRDKATGELLYVGRTLEGAPPAHISRAMVQERFSSLADELTRLGALENAPSGDYQGNVVSCHQRAKQLVEDTQAGEPGPLQLQGIAARLLKRWDEAASVFRRVTELRPEYLAGWLELTWALASLRRFEEAEHAARRAVDLDPDGAGALGNLAAVLLERDKVDEARVVAEKALAADPVDAKNQAVVAAIERAAPRARSWWRRS